MPQSTSDASKQSGAAGASTAGGQPLLTTMTQQQLQQQQQQQHLQMQQQQHQHAMMMAAAAQGHGAAAMGGMGGMGAGGGAGTVVLLNGVRKSAEALTYIFNLMCFWGNVQRIKFVHKRDDVAMVEYTVPDEAANALRFFKGVELFGTSLRLAPSTFPGITIGGQEKFAKEYTTLKMYRYVKGTQSPNYSNLCMPTSKLHLAYLHGYNEAEIREMFAPFGKVVSFSYVKDNATMGYVQMENPGQACTGE